MKYRKTLCTKDYSEIWPSLGKSKMWGSQPVEMRKKYYICIHCKENHLVKDIKHLNEQ